MHREAFRFVCFFSKNANVYLTFPVNNCEVWIGGTYAKDELVSNKRFVRVNGTYCLNQLRTKEQSMRHHMEACNYYT